MAVISIANQKGGVGKTSSAIEIAAALSDTKSNVLLIDLDQQCNLSGYVGLTNDSPTIYDVLHGNVSVKDSIYHQKYFDVITASPSLSLADREFVGNDDVFLLSDVLDIVKEQLDYDYVIIDNSPSRNILLTMAYIASDYIIIPTECDNGSLDGIIAINSDIVKLRDGKRHYTQARIMGFIMTKYEKTIMHGESFKELENIRDTIEPDAFILPVRKSIVVSECKTMQESLQEYDKYSNPAVDYRAIAKEIMRRTEIDK